MSNQGHDYKRFIAFVMIPEPNNIWKKSDHTANKQPKPPWNVQLAEEMKSLLYLSVLLRIWIIVTTAKNGDISMQLCQVNCIDKVSKTIMVQDENDELSTIEIIDIINVSEMKT